MRVDRQSRKIYDVSLMTVGEAIGHDEFVDDTTLRLMMELMPAKTKVKIDHTGGTMTTAGYITQPRIEGNQIRGDVVLFDSCEDHPLVLDMAEEIPDEFGFSANILKTVEAVDGKLCIRPTAVRSLDLVDMPATNPAGLYQQKPNKKMDEELKALTEKVEELSAKLEKHDEEYKALSAKLENSPEPDLEKEKELEEEKEKELAEKLEEKSQELAAKYEAIAKEQAAQFSKIATEAALATVAKVLGKSATYSQADNNPPELDFNGVVAQYQSKDGFSKADAVSKAVKSHSALYAKHREAMSGN